MRYAIVLLLVITASGQEDTGWQAKSIFRAGKPLLISGEYEGAIAQFQEALKKDAGLADAWSALAIAYGRLGRTAEKIQALEAAIRVAPLSTEAHYQLGIAYILNGSRSRALLQADRLAQLDPERAAILRTLADAIIVDFNGPEMLPAVTVRDLARQFR